MPGLNGTGPAGMGPMTGGARGWCNPYSPLYAGLYAVPYAYRPYYAPVVGFWPYRAYPWVYGFWRPRWGLRGFWGRGIGWGRGRGWGRWW
ncbi:MAG: hypothetical protein DRI52_10065 [Chloroflexi bacterium]|nr:MAG: hypothetical protein DRI52_10065 [Chloroflexota bacterium]HDH09763.1 hypothetical protein [Chloroflexota bacterium]